MKKDRPHSIYLLIDPRDGAVRYVGKSKNPGARLNAHIKESLKRQNTAKKTWIHHLVTHNQAPLIKVIAQIPDEAQARAMESITCRKYRDTIYNIHDPAKGARDFNRQKGKQTMTNSNKQ